VINITYYQTNQELFIPQYAFSSHFER